MIKDLDFSDLVMVSAVKNINELGDYNKDILVTITMIHKKDSIDHLEGIEHLVAKLSLEENKKYIKLSASYSTENSKIKLDSPIKVLFSSPVHKYKKCAFFEREVNSELLEDVEFVNSTFERTDEELKRVFL